MEYKTTNKCKNKNAYDNLCKKCGKCGRRFRRGILVDNTGREFDKYLDEAFAAERKQELEKKFWG